MIRANLIVIALLLVAGCGYFVLDRAVGGQEDNPGITFRLNANATVSPAVPDEFERESASFREAEKSATFRVAYRETYRATDRAARVTEKVVYQQATERRR